MTSKDAQGNETINISDLSKLLPPPLESTEQELLFAWVSSREAAYPELKMLHHIPNGGMRNKREAARLKKQGVKPGVPDICLPVPRGQYHGLYIELKRVRQGRETEAQTAWIAALNEQGYYACTCYGWMNATTVLLMYLNDWII